MDNLGIPVLLGKATSVTLTNENQRHSTYPSRFSLVVSATDITLIERTEISKMTYQINLKTMTLTANGKPVGKSVWKSVIQKIHKIKSDLQAGHVTLIDRN
jgi:hypothetical protein